MENQLNIASTVSLPEFNTKKVVEYLKHDMLLAMYRKNPNKPEHMAEFQIELNQKIAATYQKWYGKKFNPKVHEKNGRQPMFLYGQPGVGKTASYLAAGKIVADALDLNFVKTVTDDYVPEMKDFVMVVQETAGENSALTFGGVPKAEEVTINGITETVLKKATNYRFNVFKHCAGGALLFDDAANAASVIQNVLLPVAQFNSFQGLAIPNACIGFTGNLGALDNTYTTDQSAALLTRVFSVVVTDTPENFIERVYADYDDDLGDFGHCNYIKRNGAANFTQAHETGSKSGHACSRTHEDFIRGGRSLIERHGGRGVGEQKALAEIMDLAKSKFGHKEGTKIAAYMDAVFRGADPLAKKYILDNNPDQKEFNKQYSGGSGREDMAYGYQFATACGDYTANFIASAEDKKAALPEAMKRFGTAVLQLTESEYAYALEHLKQKLANGVHEFSKAGKYTRELTNDIREIIAVEIVKLPDCGQSRRDITIEGITDFDKIQSTNIHNTKKGPRSVVN